MAFLSSLPGFMSDQIEHSASGFLARRRGLLRFPTPCPSRVSRLLPPDMSTAILFFNFAPRQLNETGLHVMLMRFVTVSGSS